MDILPALKHSRARAIGRTAAIAGAGLALSLALAGTSWGKPPSVTISVPDGLFAETTVATVEGTSSIGQDSGSYRVRNQCFQAGERVLTEYVRPDGSGQAELTLGPTSLWTSGDATCTAEYGSFGKNGRWKAMASDTFHVDG